jgi:hypothetical protein
MKADPADPGPEATPEGASCVRTDAQLVPVPFDAGFAYRPPPADCSVPIANCQ